MRWRLFLTSWVLTCTFFATDFVREHYLAMRIAEHATFDLSPYLGFHEDIFQNPARAPHGGVHHGGNPGASMLAAVPLFLARPLIDAVAQRTSGNRDTTGAEYRDTRRARARFYKLVRANGLDVKFGLVAAITVVFCMAPIMGCFVLGMFSVLERCGVARSRAAWLSMLALVGTPMLFRAGFLNHNLMLAVAGLWAFLLLWKASDSDSMPASHLLIAGALAGFGVTNDYSGAVGAAMLGLYAGVLACQRGLNIPALARAWWLFGIGALPMVSLLWIYQWAAFGHPFYPPQHWMPVQNQWVTTGYQGVSGPQTDLAAALLFDHRFGLLITMPLALLALVAPFLRSSKSGVVPRRELYFALGISGAYLLFFSSVHYVHLQWNTGIRYLIPAVPFLFLAAIPAFLAMPRVARYAAAAVAIGVGLAMAMTRLQQGPVASLRSVVVEGPQLPWLTTLQKMSASYLPGAHSPWAVAVVYLLVAITLAAIWWAPWRAKSLSHG